MFSLIPTENWDYGFGDLMRGLPSAILSRGLALHINIIGVGRCLPTRSARVGIALALKGLQLRPGASVAVPLYCCPVVLRAIAEAGCRARFIEVEPYTYCMSATDLAAKSSEVDAVIAVHMFGNLCDVPALRKAAPCKPIIEDCAQAIGSRLEDRPTGSFGDIAVFSFRSGKYISAGEGGAVYSSSPEIESRLSKLISQLPVPSRRDEVVHVFTTCLRSMLRTQPLWGLVGNALWSGYTRKVSPMSQASIVHSQIYQTDWDLIVRRMTILPAMIERQRWNADYYTRNLTVDSGMICPEAPGTFFNRLQFPLLVPSAEQCHLLAKRLQRDRISTARPYKDIVAIAKERYGYSGDCPQSERIAKSVIVIPCNYALGTAEVERISTCVSRAWAEIAGPEVTVNMPSNPSAVVSPPKEKLEHGCGPHHLS